MARHVSLGEYQVGFAGLALLRLHRSGVTDAVDEVVAELRGLVEHLDDPASRASRRTDFLSVVDGYRRWSAVYDVPGNPVIAHDERLVRPMLDALVGDPVLDAACGTGRHIDYLAAAGHDMVGVDISEAMLAVARRKGHGASLHRADLHALPLADGVVAGAVCALALEHVHDLGVCYRELARVVRPGGRLVVSTVHPAIALLGWNAWFVDSDGRGDVVTYNHSISDHVQAARAAGLHLTDLEETHISLDEAVALSPRATPAAAAIALVGVPMVLAMGFVA